MSHSRKFDDGVTRCSWLNAEQIYIDYHDHEWGIELRGDREMFERITLEGFQAGLSWITILKRREGFRKAFKNFDLRKVSRMGEVDIERLMQDQGIIRNRAKIESTIRNAQVVLELQKSGQSISDIVWSFAPPASNPKVGGADFLWATSTVESAALSKHLRKLGFGFVGPTTMHALMQATGVISDHAPGCFKSN